MLLHQLRLSLNSRARTRAARASEFALSITVMAITKCLIWVQTVSGFTVATRAVGLVWPHQRLDGPRWLDGE